MYKFTFLLVVLFGMTSFAKVTVTSKVTEAGTCKAFLKDIPTCKASKCEMTAEENGAQNKYVLELIPNKKVCTLNYSISSAQERAIKTTGGSKEIDRTLRNNLEAFLNSMLSKPEFTYELDNACCFSQNPNQKFCAANSATASFLYLLTAAEGSPLCPEKKPEQYFEHLHHEKKPQAPEVKAEDKNIIPPAVNANNPECQALLSGVPFCAKGTCSLETPTGEKTIFEMPGGKPNEDCPVRITKKNQPLDCKVAKAYLPELKNYIDFTSAGGKAEFTPCTGVNKDDASMGCQIKLEAKTILNFPEFGLAKGICAPPAAPAPVKTPDQNPDEKLDR